MGYFRQNGKHNILSDVDKRQIVMPGWLGQRLLIRTYQNGPRKDNWLTGDNAMGAKGSLMRMRSKASPSGPVCAVYDTKVSAHTMHCSLLHNHRLLKVSMLTLSTNRSTFNRHVSITYYFYIMWIAGPVCYFPGEEMPPECIVERRHASRGIAMV